MGIETTRIGAPPAELGEGPVWHNGHLWWVDIVAGQLHRFDITSGTHQCQMVGDLLGVAVPCDDGRWLVATGRRLGFYTWATKEFEEIAEVEKDQARNRFNDGKCDPGGRLWVGTMNMDCASPSGALYCLNSDLRATPKLSSITISNGLGWSPDGSKMYYTDTATQRVDVFDFDLASGELVGRRMLVEVPSAAGSPDGLAVDCEGNVWVAIWGGGAVECYDGTTGERKQRIEVEATQVSSCCFGGPEMDQLFITTAWHGMPATQRDSEPAAGEVFTCRPGVSGLPCAVFRGRQLH